MYLSIALDIKTRLPTSLKTQDSEGSLLFPSFIPDILQQIKINSTEFIYGFKESIYVFGGVAPYHY